jgi:hypothetical protein
MATCLPLSHLWMSCRLRIDPLEFRLRHLTDEALRVSGQPRNRQTGMTEQIGQDAAAALRSLNTEPPMLLCRNRDRTSARRWEDQLDRAISLRRRSGGESG